jgi:peptidoglycan/LPS O-acetylase OafA/YrhL
MLQLRVFAGEPMTLSGGRIVDPGGREGLAVEKSAQQERRSPGLDTLRGCGVLAIIIWHYMNNAGLLRSPPSLEFLQNLTGHFFLGVDLFFVLSGFLIGGSLMATKGQPGYFRNYFARRLGRIFPLYFLWLSVYIVLIVVGAERRFGGAFPWLMTPEIPLVYYFTFTQNFAFAANDTWGPAWLGVTWSLAIEMHFYVVAALLVYFIPKKQIGVASIAIIACCELARYFGTQYLGDHATYILTPTRIDAPFIGVFCAWLWQNDKVRGVFIQNGDRLRYASMIALALVYHFDVQGRSHSPLSLYLTIGMFFGFATLAFATPATRAANSAVGFIRWCGVRCYAIYIIHVGILGLAGHLLFDWPPNVFPAGVGWPAVLLACGATFGLASASWTYFERPVLIAITKLLSQPIRVEKVGVGEPGALADLESKQAF